MAILRFKSNRLITFPNLSDDFFFGSFEPTYVINPYLNHHFRLSPDFFNISRNQSFSNWNMEFGYRNQPENVEPYPIRVFATGKQASFTVVLRIFNEGILAFIQWIYLIE